MFPDQAYLMFVLLVYIYSVNFHQTGKYNSLCEERNSLNWVWNKINTIILKFNLKFSDRFCLCKQYNNESLLKEEYEPHREKTGFLPMRK